VRARDDGPQHGKRKTDRIDAWVLVELARRDLVPAIWLPGPRVRAERERARWRLHPRARAPLLPVRAAPAVSRLYGGIEA